MQSNAHGKKEQDLSVSFGQSRATIDRRRKRSRSHDTQKHRGNVLSQRPKQIKYLDLSEERWSAERNQ